MNRRSFLAALGVAPVVAAGAVAAAPKAYASGGYVGPFKSYSSGVGLTGEYGPEAIMPLRRGPDGPTFSDPKKMGRYLRSVYDGDIPIYDPRKESFAAYVSRVSCSKDQK